MGYRNGLRVLASLAKRYCTACMEEEVSKQIGYSEVMLKVLMIK